MIADDERSIEFPSFGAWVRRFAGAALIAALLIAACGACSPWRQGRPDARLGDNCVRQAGRGPIARAVNYVEPELCERKVAVRGPYHVRTPAVPVPSAEQGR